MSVLEGTATLAGAGLQSPALLTCGQLIPQVTQQPGTTGASTTEMEPGSPTSLLSAASAGAGTQARGWGGAEKGLASRGAEAVLQSSEQVGSVLALDQIVACRGHCTEAELG